MWAHTHENENVVSEYYESGIINLILYKGYYFI
jgi:hypothetical protein